MHSWIWALLSVCCLSCRAEVIYEPCSPESETAASCEAENKVCIAVMDSLDEVIDNNITRSFNDTNSTVVEDCRECKEGFIPAWHSHLVAPGTCYPIENITWPEFVDAFQPTLRDTGVSNETRLEFVKLIATFVSFHNSRIPPPDFFVEVNHLSALSRDEIKQRNGYRADSEKESEISMLDFTTHGGKDRPHAEKNSTRQLQPTLPASVDWVTSGAVTSVKDQGQCGCCWTISTVGVIEGITAIDTNYQYVESLSFQQLISCDTSNNGCDGGSVTSAMQYSDSNSLGGLTTDAQYPFTDSGGTTTTTCSANQLAVQVWDTNMVTTSSNPSNYQDRITQMKQGVAVQPVSILINANCQEFQSYSGGVMTSDSTCACTDSSCLDHAVLMVGYNDAYDPPYWLVKNSWGTRWGESGYVRVAQTASDTMPYGLLGLLAQGAVLSKGANTTVEIPNAATCIMTESTLVATILSSVGVVLLTYFDF